MARAPADPNKPKRVVNRTPKQNFALLSVNDDGKPYIIALTSNAITILKAVTANPGATLVEGVEISK